MMNVLVLIWHHNYQYHRKCSDNLIWPTLENELIFGRSEYPIWLKNVFYGRSIFHLYMAHGRPITFIWPYNLHITFIFVFSIRLSEIQTKCAPLIISKMQCYQISKFCLQWPTVECTQRWSSFDETSLGNKAIWHVAGGSPLVRTERRESATARRRGQIFCVALEHAPYLSMAHLPAAPSLSTPPTYADAAETEQGNAHSLTCSSRNVTRDVTLF